MSERGDASVEFLGILIVVVIPVLYIVLAIGQVSAGAMAVDAGAREASEAPRMGAPAPTAAQPQMLICCPSSTTRFDGRR